MIEKRLEDFGIRVMLLVRDFIAERISKEQCLKRFNSLVKNYSTIILLAIP